MFSFPPIAWETIAFVAPWKAASVAHELIACRDFSACLELRFGRLDPHVVSSPSEKCPANLLLILTFPQPLVREGTLAEMPGQRALHDSKFTGPRALTSGWEKRGREKYCAQDGRLFGNWHFPR